MHSQEQELWVVSGDDPQFSACLWSFVSSFSYLNYYRLYRFSQHQEKLGVLKRNPRVEPTCSFPICSHHHGRGALFAPSSSHQRESGEAAVQGQRRGRLRPHGRQRLVQPGGPPGIRGGADCDLRGGGASRPRAPVWLGEQGLRQHRLAVHCTAEDQPWRHRPESAAQPERSEANRHFSGVIYRGRATWTWTVILLLPQSR